MNKVWGNFDMFQNTKYLYYFVAMMLMPLHGSYASVMDQRPLRHPRKRRALGKKRRKRRLHKAPQTSKMFGIVATGTLTVIIMLLSQEYTTHTHAEVFLLPTKGHLDETSRSASSHLDTTTELASSGDPTSEVADVTRAPSPRTSLPPTPTSHQEPCPAQRLDEAGAERERPKDMSVDDTCSEDAPSHEASEDFCIVKAEDMHYGKKFFKEGEILAALAYSLAKGKVEQETADFIQASGLTYQRIEVENEGLVPFLLYPTKANPQSDTVRIMLTFRGTQTKDKGHASVKRDWEGFQGGIGFASLKEHFHKIQEAIETRIASFQGKKIFLIVSGHSLGGTDAQHTVVHLLRAVAKHQGAHPNLKGIVRIRIYTKNAPGVAPQIITDASEYLRQLNSRMGNPLQVEAYYQRTQADFIQSFGAGYIFSQPTDLAYRHVEVHLLIHTKRFSTLEQAKFDPHRKYLFIKQKGGAKINEGDIFYVNNQEGHAQDNLRMIHKIIGCKKPKTIGDRIKQFLFRQSNKAKQCM